jgi:hypothetical protein
LATIRFLSPPVIPGGLSLSDAIDPRRRKPQFCAGK